MARDGAAKLFRAHDKRSGEIVAEIDLGQRQTGVPMTYAIGGQQYIVVATGAPGRGGAVGCPDRQSIGAYDNAPYTRFLICPLKLKVEEGISCVIKMAYRSSMGSTQKSVEARPPQ